MTLQEELEQARANQQKAYENWAKAHAGQEVLEALVDVGRANHEVSRITALIKEEQA